MLLETAQIEFMHEETSDKNLMKQKARQRVWLFMGWIAVALFVMLVFLGGLVRAPSAALVVLVAFLPWIWAVTTLMLSVGWFVTGRLTNAIWTPLLMFFLGAIFFGPAVIGTFLPSEKGLVVMEYNVQRLWGGENANETVTCVNREIEKAGPDILVLLELERQQISKLSDEYAGQCAHINYFGGESDSVGGIAVCTREGSGLMISRVEESNYQDNDGWQYLLVELSNGTSQLNIIAVHLDSYKVKQRDISRRLGDHLVSVAATQGGQSVALLERLEKLKDPTIIAGDFNATSEFSLHTRLRKTLRDVWREAGWGFGATTVFRGVLPLRVDFLYTTQDIRAVRAGVGSAECADHRPIIGQLDLL